MKKNDVIEISVLTGILLLITCVNYIVGKVSATALLLAGAGIFFYSFSVHLPATSATCDYIQTGEAAVGSFAIFACMRFITGDPYLVVLAAFASLLLYNIYLRVLIEPLKGELVLNGILVHLALAAVFFFLVLNKIALPASSLEKIFSGFITASPDNYPGMGAAFLPGIIAVTISLVLRPEIRLFSLGKPFVTGPRTMIAAASIGSTLVRSLFTTAIICLLGCLCGFGLYARAMSRSEYPDLTTAMVLFICYQFMLILMSFASPWFAITLAACCSYALYPVYAKKRTCLYDRN